MKKIININFQGRVIPIEDTAYHILKQYIESLRGYFANEEGRDEIINDIESRIAELFSDRLKRATTCITDDDVNAVIAGIGRPEELQEAEGPQTAASPIAAASAGAGAGAGAGQQAYQGSQVTTGSRRLYRAENDKLLGGVAAGLANYFGIDPAIMRLLFVLFFFTGFGILLYIILWLVVPPRALVTNVRKRLYRNPDNRMIAGVSGGIAAYLNIDVWIPRVIFLLPFVLGALSNIFRNGWMDFDPMPHFLFNGIGGTLLVIYIVLWIVLPEATTSTEKLEMRGEKVDLESIKKTVKEELESMKGRAEKVGGEIKERATYFTGQVKQAGQNFGVETGPVVRRTGSGVAHAIGVLFKAFFLFVAGIIVFALLMALVALLFSGIGAFPFKSFILSGFWQNFLAWSTLFLFLGIPVIALLVWLIRRLMGVKSRKNYLGYTFGSLWIIGLVSAILLSGLIARNFRSRTSVRQDLGITQPVSNKLLVKVTEGNVKYYGSDWFGFNGDWPFFSKNEDSIMMNTVRVQLIKSNDLLYHMYAVKFSNGNTPSTAEELANRIIFNVSQTDSMVYLPRGFTITRNDKFRNQQVMLVLEVPVGKKIQLDKSIDRYNWFSINMDRRRGWNIDFDDRWNNNYSWSSNTEYIMTADGLKSTEKMEREEDKIHEQTDPGEDGSPDNNDGYRYKGNKRDTIISRPDTNATISYHAITHKPNSQDPIDSHKALYTLLMIY